MGKFIIILFLFFNTKVFASSCCGQSPTSFTVLSLQQKLSLTSSFSLSDSVGRVYDDPDKFFIWQKDKKRQVQSLNLNLASSLSERSQVFVNFGHLSGSYKSQGLSSSANHISDVLAGYNYELVPEYSFSYWKPTVYLSALLNLPTGRSIYSSQSLGEGAGVTGYDQYGIGLGLTLKKVYFPLSLSLQIKSLRLLKANFDSTQVSGFYDSSVALFTSYNFDPITATMGLSYNHLSSKEVNGTPSGVSQHSSLSFGLQAPIFDEVYFGLNYADETLIGKAKNTLLNRTYSMNLNFNYF